MPAETNPVRIQTLNTLFDEAAARWPGQTALLVQERPAHAHAAPCCRNRKARGEEHSITYKELRCLILRAASVFRAKGIGRGDSVAILHRNGLGFVVAYFGLSRIGATAVPINFMVQKADELRYMLQDCRAKGIVTQRAFLREVFAAKTGLPDMEHVWMTEGPADATEDFWAELANVSPVECPGEPAMSRPVLPQDTAAVLYTSGTTGKPKGAMLSHANITANCDAVLRHFQLREREVFLCLLPMFHSFAWTGSVVLPLLIGAEIVVVSSVTPAKPWLMRMGRRGVSVMLAVPQIFSVLARQAVGWQGLFLRRWSFRKVRLCVSGAAPLAPQTAEEFRRAFGQPILEGYGLTETSPIVSVNTPAALRPGSVGRPLAGVEVRIADEEGRALAAGQEGEIHIRGHNVMQGYLNQPEATRESLSKDGWLKTGDVGILDSMGFLTIRDRLKDMIIVKGLKVFPAQLECILLENPNVQEAAVIGVPDETGDETIKAFIVLKKGAAADKAALAHFCRQRLDPYKRPRDFEFVRELPKNSLQKVLKRILRDKEIERRATARA
ncbi:MAG: AMP-binding protein [Elusimicrobiota bacterium]|jgi:long-chain acyl-CoA synthetase